MGYNYNDCSSLCRRPRVPHALILLLGLTMMMIQGGASSSLELGKATNKVIALTKDTFHIAIKDPANPKWLLKFYAPWCGHCKRLAPVLDHVAPNLEGQLSIGKIDCTVEKRLCDEHAVRGYPTLKFTLDGAMHDYPGGRAEQDFVQFAKKLNRPSVQEVNSVARALEVTAELSDDGVGFVAFHPDARGENTEERIQSTSFTQVFAQVARKQHASGLFLLLDPNAADDAIKELLSPEEREKLLDTKTTTTEEEDGDPESSPPPPRRLPALFCRVEANVAPRCFDGLHHDGDEDGSPKITTEDLLSFVRTHGMATVTHLGPQNFHRVGRNGRPLVIGIVDATAHPEHAELARRELARYATSGPPESRDSYYYGWFDGKQWARFLAQFKVQPDRLPQLLVLDVPQRNYWQNETYGLGDVEEFLDAVRDGTIPQRSADPKGITGFLDKLYMIIVEFQPWSVIFLVLFVLCLVIIIVSIVSPGEDFRPPYPREQQHEQEEHEQQHQQQGQAAAAGTTTTPIPGGTAAAAGATAAAGAGQQQQQQNQGDESKKDQ